MKKDSTKTLFIDWDPVGLISDGFPLDEYDREIYILRLWFEKNQTANEVDVNNKLRSVFAEWLGDIPDILDKEIDSKSKDVLLSLQQDLAA